MTHNAALVAVIMGSKSDWDTMQHADKALSDFGVAHECQIVSAHRTPAWLAEFATTAQSRGIEVIIAGAGGAAHLPGMVAAQTTLPVLGVPVESAALKGLDSLLSIVQMPGGVPVGTLAIGKAGATNAALLAISILALKRPELSEKLAKFRADQTRKVREDVLPGDQSETEIPPPPIGPRRLMTCSFCGKTSREVWPMVEGPGDAYICKNCVDLAANIVDIMEKQDNPPADPSP